MAWKSAGFLAGPQLGAKENAARESILKSIQSDGYLRSAVEDAFRDYQAQGGTDDFQTFLYENGTMLSAQLETIRRQKANEQEGREKEAEIARTKEAKEAKWNSAFGEQDNALQQFIARFSAPLFDKNGNPADEEVARIVAAGRNIGQAEANNRGIEGGLSVANTQRQAMAATNPLAQFRQGLAAQAMAQRQNLLGMRSNRDLSLGQMAQQNDHFLANLAEQQYLADAGLAQQRHAAQQGMGSGIGSLIGGGIGALGFLAGPAVGAATMSAGSAIGGGLGGMSAGGFNPPARGGYGTRGYRWGV